MTSAGKPFSGPFYSFELAPVDAQSHLGCIGEDEAENASDGQLVHATYANRAEVCRLPRSFTELRSDFVAY